MLSFFIGLLLFTTTGANMANAAENGSKCPEIRRDHPRIFFNADTWPAVKANAEGSAHKDLLKLIEDVDRITDDPHCEGTGPIDIKYGKQPDGSFISRDDTPVPDIKDFGFEAAQTALVWRFTGEEKYLEKARKLLVESVRGYVEATNNRRPVSWYSTGRINALCAYDWIYEGLSDEERRSIIVPLVEHCHLVQESSGLDIPRQVDGEIESGFYCMLPLLWYAGLASYGDSYCDELAGRMLEEGYDLCMQMLRYRAKTAGDDGGLNSATIEYSMGVYPFAHFNFMYTLESATGISLAGDYPSIGLMPNWLWWNWIRDDSNPMVTRITGQGDSYHGQNTIGNSGYYTHLNNYIHFYKDINPDAAALAAGLCSILSNQSWNSPFPVYPFLTGNDKVTPLPKEQIEHSPLKARHFEGMGQIIMRSGWTDDDTYCTFTAGGQPHHKHYDENSFAIYKYDHLALDAGCRGRQNDLNLAYYYSQSVAHNTVLIHKPGEKLPYHWGVKTDDETANFNYGGQVKNQPAEILAFETNQDYSYIASDATDCYGEKCTEAVRQFVYLTPDCFIVYDRVGSTDPSYLKNWLLHVENEPIYKGNVMQSDCGKGRIFCETLLPKNPVIEKIGGPGKEFWVRDRNIELNPEYLKSCEDIARQTGRGTYFGKWRIEVSPSSRNKDDRFLNVITATGTSSSKPVKARLLKDAGRDGVRITVNGKTYEIWFNRNGKVGGDVIIGGESHPLIDKIAPQSGIIL